MTAMARGVGLRGRVATGRAFGVAAGVDAVHGAADGTCSAIGRLDRGMGRIAHGAANAVAGFACLAGGVRGVQPGACVDRAAGLRVSGGRGCGNPRLLIRGGTGTRVGRTIRGPARLVRRALRESIALLLELLGGLHGLRYGVLQHVTRAYAHAAPTAAAQMYLGKSGQGKQACRGDGNGKQSLAHIGILWRTACIDAHGAMTLCVHRRLDAEPRT